MQRLYLTTELPWAFSGKEEYLLTGRGRGSITIQSVRVQLFTDYYYN